MSKKPRKSPSNSFDTESALHDNASKLRDLLDSISLHGDGEHPSVVADIARISVALTTVCSEIRQHAKAAQRQLDSFPVDQILAHLKQRLSADDRADAVRELAGEREEESLL